MLKKASCVYETVNSLPEKKNVTFTSLAKAIFFYFAKAIFLNFAKASMLEKYPDSRLEMDLSCLTLFIQMLHITCKTTSTFFFFNLSSLIYLAIFKSNQVF